MSDKFTVVVKGADIELAEAIKRIAKRKPQTKVRFKIQLPLPPKPPVVARDFTEEEKMEVYRFLESKLQETLGA